MFYIIHLPFKINRKHWDFSKWVLWNRFYILALLFRFPSYLWTSAILICERISKVFQIYLLLRSRPRLKNWFLNLRSRKKNRWELYRIVPYFKANSLSWRFWSICDNLRSRFWIKMSIGIDAAKILVNNEIKLSEKLIPYFLTEKRD